MIVKETDDPTLYRMIHDSNLLRQYDLLKDCVNIAIKQQNHIPDEASILALNQTAVVNLCEHAGRFRTHDVLIKNSPHKPPPWQEARDHTAAFLAEIQRRWQRSTELEMAAYCLWRINWIHPFAEGNGRTARAVAYFTLCVKFGMWLPGANIIPKQIRLNRQPYYKALRLADDTFDDKAHTMDLSELTDYLSGLLKVQLA